MSGAVPGDVPDRGVHVSRHRHPSSPSDRRAPNGPITCRDRWVRLSMQSGRSVGACSAEFLRAACLPCGPGHRLDTPRVTTLRPTFTVRSAVEACQISEKTLRRRLPALQQHGATVDARGRWRIPYEALIAVELKPGRPARPDAGHDQVVSDQVTTAIDQAKDQAKDQADQG